MGSSAFTALDWIERLRFGTMLVTGLCRVTMGSGKPGRYGKRLKKFHAWKSHGI